MNAMMHLHKSGKITVGFRFSNLGCYKTTPLQESRPEILKLRKKVGILLTKTGLSFPGSFFFGMVRPLNFEEFGSLVSSLPFRFI